MSKPEPAQLWDAITASGWVTLGETSMSNSIPFTPDDGAREQSDIPRAMIHKNILDEAQAAPNASMEEIAEKVGGASSGLVERVLDEYGDPAESSEEKTMTDDSEATERNSKMERPNGPHPDEDTADPPVMEPTDLTDKQRRTLRAIFENPSATQVELAEKLDVTNVTISNRVNEIDGFEWKKRQEFVNNVFGNGRMSSDEGETISGSPADQIFPQDRLEKIDVIADHVESLERRLVERPLPDGLMFVNPDLASKIIHACLDSDHFSEEEELEVVKAVISATCTGR